MKLFYLLAAFLVLLSGLAARVILEPIQPPQASAKVTLIKVKGKSASPAQLSFAKSKITGFPRCTKCI